MDIDINDLLLGFGVPLMFAFPEAHLFSRRKILYTLARNQSQNMPFGALAACGTPHH